MKLLSLYKIFIILFIICLLGEAEFFYIMKSSLNPGATHAILHWICLGALMIFCTFGLFGLRVQEVSLMSGFFYFLYRYPVSTQLNTHYDIPPLYIFFLLAITGLGKNRSKILTILRPHEFYFLIRVYISLIYLSSAMSKLIYSGWDWVSGYTLSQALLGISMSRDLNSFLLLTELPALMMVLAITTLCFELFFSLILFMPKLTRFFQIAGLLFHLTILLILGINFFYFFGLMYLFLSPEKSQFSQKS